jgi:hypothetical protein
VTSTLVPVWCLVRSTVLYILVLGASVDGVVVMVSVLRMSQVLHIEERVLAVHAQHWSAEV